MNMYIPVRNEWASVALYCHDPKAWLYQAQNLRGSLEALLLHDRQIFDYIFNKKTQRTHPILRLSGVERMLIGFSLENLIKAVILQDPKKANQAFAKKGNLRWIVLSHNLQKLCKEAKVDFDEQELIFLNLWTTCSTWAGRYPLPKNENELPRHRKPVKSSDELLNSRIQEIEKSISSGIPLQIEQYDLMHSGVGTQEITLYRNMFDRLHVCLKKSVY